MKINKYIYMLMAGAAFSACSSEDPVFSNTSTANADEVNGDSITISTTLESELVALPTETADEPNSEQKTRSSITSDCDVQFEAGDKMYVSDGTLSRVYTLASTGSTAVFKVTGDNMFAGLTAGENKFFSFYPAEAVTSSNGKTVTARVYGEQDYTENTDNTFGGYMASIKNTNTAGHANFTYRLIGSVIDIGLSSLGVTPASVSIMTNSGVSLSGDFTFNTSDGTTLSLINGYGNGNYNATSMSDVLTVNNINKKVDYVRFYVLPVVVTGGLTITVKDTNGNYYTKKTTNTIGTAATSGLTKQENLTGGTIATPYYKKINFGAESTASRTGNWMACVPSNIKYTMLTLPGSHNAATGGNGTLYGSYSAGGCSLYSYTSRTQNVALDQQLKNGVRALDLRPYANHTLISGNGTSSKDDLYIKHGGSFSVSTDLLFVNALKTIAGFLENNPSETVFVLVHQENDNASDSEKTSWGSAIIDCMSDDAVKGYIYTIPSSSSANLSALRGKMVIVARDDVGATTLCGKTGWGSEFASKTVFYGAESGGSGTSGWTLIYQDTYDNGTAWDTKWTDKIVKFAKENAAANTNNTQLAINMCNIAGPTTSGATNVYLSAQDINKRICSNSDSPFLDHSLGRLGFTFLDFTCSESYTYSDTEYTMYGMLAFKAIRDHNFDYVYKNRTRIDHTGSSSSATSTGATVSGDEYADDGTVYARQR